MEDIKVFHFNSDMDELFEQLKRYVNQEMIVPIIGSGFSVNEITLNGQKVPSGKDMKEEMINSISEAGKTFNTKMIEQLKNKSYSEVANIYTKLVDERKRKQYIKRNFLEVKLDGAKKQFINLPFKTLYTLNFDDAIEYNNDNVEVVTSNQEYVDEEILKSFRENGKTILYKIHGDAKNHLKYNETLIHSQQEYVASIVKNHNILSQLSADLMSNCVMFIGCDPRGRFS